MSILVSLATTIKIAGYNYNNYNSDNDTNNDNSNDSSEEENNINYFISTEDDTELETNNEINSKHSFTNDIPSDSHTQRDEVSSSHTEYPINHASFNCHLRSDCSLSRSCRVYNAVYKCTIASISGNFMYKSFVTTTNL